MTIETTIGLATVAGPTARCEVDDQFVDNVLGCFSSSSCSYFTNKNQEHYILNKITKQFNNLGLSLMENA